MGRILGGVGFIRLGVRYANRLGRLLCIFESMATLWRLGDGGRPPYRICQKLMTRGEWDALTLTCGVGNAGGGNAKLDLLRRRADGASG